MALLFPTQSYLKLCVKFLIRDGDIWGHSKLSSSYTRSVMQHLRDKLTHRISVGCGTR